MEKTLLNVSTIISAHGCQGEFKDTEERYEGNTCYVNGIPCKAKEHHFGGIGVEGV
ncbi:hypothetical protein [Cecembia rubra]|uniref:hypothetical protein n=1 Tax=Cecembia rubra TaxID=1485585 RepID=UPI0014759E5D|nr:hypothetical protein [Cecembia rubra]